jgi:glycerol-3-phosphate dehydrogenase
MQVGTTEREVDDGWAPIAPAEREELYAALEQCLPAIPWRTLTVHREELGVRPLLAGRGSTARLAREAVLERHPRFGNLRLVLGGKLTTARQLMDQLATELTGQACPASAVEPLAVAAEEPGPAA